MVDNKNETGGVDASESRVTGEYSMLPGDDEGDEHDGIKATIWLKVAFETVIELKGRMMILGQGELLPRENGED